MDVKGKLEKIVHKYEESKFTQSIIYIQNFPGSISFYGLVPESLLGKEIEFEEEACTSKEFSQRIIYKEKGMEYKIVGIYSQNKK